MGVANILEPDPNQTPRFVASDLGQHCLLSMSVRMLRVHTLILVHILNRKIRKQQYLRLSDTGRGLTGVYFIFLIFAQKHRLWVLVRSGC